MSRIIIERLGQLDYKEAWEIQKTLFRNLIESKNMGNSADMRLLLLEHPHVYTLGLNGERKNILFSDDLLSSIGASFYHIERGGDITYHGFGQLIGYPILDLERLQLGIKSYIALLEDAVIDTIAEYGIIGERLNGSIGVWLESETERARKICAIGVKVSRFVTMHGFALNVSTDLDYYKYINPCGFTDRGVTSIKKECGYTPSLVEVEEIFISHFNRLFNSRII
ncbi:MAG: lipoyl(octanoyl) transferase LipB [Bacteroidales bacterium]|nr:lipoyl(octanoyl) transferase LipB [Bacteroidales bacterium]